MAKRYGNAAQILTLGLKFRRVKIENQGIDPNNGVSEITVNASDKDPLTHIKSNHVFISIPHVPPPEIPHVITMWNTIL